MGNNYSNGESNPGRGSESNYGRGGSNFGRGSESNRPSESRDYYAYKSTYSMPNKERRFNSLDNIDELIEKLDSSVSTTDTVEKSNNQIAKEQTEKLDKLKELVATLKKEEELRRNSQLQQERSELDSSSNGFGRGNIR